MSLARRFWKPGKEEPEPDIGDAETIRNIENQGGGDDSLLTPPIPPPLQGAWSSPPPGAPAPTPNLSVPGATPVPPAPGVYPSAPGIIPPAAGVYSTAPGVYPASSGVYPRPHPSSPALSSSSLPTAPLAPPIPPPMAPSPGIPTVALPPRPSPSSPAAAPPGGGTEYRRPSRLPVGTMEGAPGPAAPPPPVSVRVGDAAPRSSSQNLAILLRSAVEKGSSDLHLSMGIPPTVRIDGYLKPLDFPPLGPNDCQKLVYSILNSDQKAKFEDTWELDFSLEIEHVGRFRVNIHKQRSCTEAAFRVVNDVIQPIKRLGLPPIVEELARRDSGLVLVTGPTGSGKTTTLASMVDLVNSERQSMIITIEDPIEYVHVNKRSIIKQREVTSDTKSFGAALRHVLRQDPDMIVIGEMRDLETIGTALTAAETGHLVLATLHTPDAAQTIDRIIDVFPPHQQQQVRIQLANSLEGIVSQQLLPIPGARGRVVAVEILIATTAIRKIIRVAKTEQITSIIQTSWDQGMITMDKSLKNLYAQGLITYDDAISKCRYPENFDQI